MMNYVSFYPDYSLKTLFNLDTLELLIYAGLTQIWDINVHNRLKMTIPTKLILFKNKYFTPTVIVGVKFSFL